MENLNQDLKAPEVLVLLLQNEPLSPLVSPLALDCLMELCKPIVYGAIKNLYFEGYERNDILQEGHMVLIKAIEEYRFDKKLKFLSYYQMMLMNHLRNILRKQKAHIRRANKNAYSLEELMETSGLHIQGLAAVDTLPEDVTIIKEAYSQYIGSLSDFETTVYASYLKKNTIEETAEILGCEFLQIQNALYRCKMKLDNYLK